MSANTPLTDALEKHERHNNVAETRYWCAQYKLLARQLEAAAELERARGAELSERIEIIRRIADRGISLAVREKHTHFTDLFQHMLNEVALVGNPRGSEHGRR